MSRRLHKNTLITAIASGALIVAACSDSQEPAGDSETAALVGVSETVSLVAVHSDKCAEVTAASTNAGAAVIQSSCNGASAQEWKLENLGNDRYTVVSVHSGLCMEVKGASMVNGGAVIQSPCNGAANQAWRFSLVATGEYRLKAVHSAKCLDVTGASTAEGAHFEQWSCNGRLDQAFRLGHPTSAGDAGSDTSAAIDSGVVAPPGWSLVWSDEFAGANGSAPDPAKWVYDVGWGDGGWGNDELEYYTNSRDNSFMKDGSLVIQARTDNLQSSMLCGTAHCKYTSARLKTLRKYEHRYGRFEARIKIPTGSGMWPAFWMMGNDFPTVDWPACGEVDVMENWGSDAIVNAGTTHDPGTNSEDGISGEYEFSSLATVQNDYHLYAIEWSRAAVKFFVDATEYHCVRKQGAPASACGAIAGVEARSPHTWPFDHPFFMLLNLAIDSSSDNLPKSTTKFPAQMLVDYVRVYDPAP